MSKINLSQYLEEREEIKQEAKIELDLSKVQKTINVSKIHKLQKQANSRNLDVYTGQSTSPKVKPRMINDERLISNTVFSQERRRKAVLLPSLAKPKKRTEVTQ